MKILSCNATRRRLQAFHDDELAVTDQIAVGAHLEWCPECAEALADLRLLRRVLRASRAPQLDLSPEESAALQGAVVTRTRAERTTSLSAIVAGMFDDMHFVYAGLAATFAMLLCVLSAMTMMRFATLRSPGSNANPVPIDAGVLLPRVLDSGAFTTTLPGGESAYMISAVVTREGTVSNPELLHASSGEPIAPGTEEAKAAEDLMGAVSRARFEPARVDGFAVAVNMVWLVTNTTVRADETPVVAPRPAGLRKRVAWHVPAAVRPTWA